MIPCHGASEWVLEYEWGMRCFLLCLPCKPGVGTMPMDISALPLPALQSNLQQFRGINTPRQRALWGSWAPSGCSGVFPFIEQLLNFLATLLLLQFITGIKMNGSVPQSGTAAAGIQCLLFTGCRAPRMCTPHASIWKQRSEPAMCCW